MKLDEVIISKKKLDEVPAGGLGQMAKKVGSRALNIVPGAAAKSKAANLAGQADLGDTANNLHKEFNGWLGRNQKTMKQATGEDLVAFLKTKGHRTKHKIPSGVLQKTQLDAALLAVSKEAMSGQGGVATGSGPVDANKDGKDDNTGKPIQQKAGSKTAGDADTAEKPKVPAELLKKLIALKPEEKKQLAELL